MKTYPTIGETLHEFVHSSGLRVYVLPKPGFGKSFAIYATDFGSVNNVFTSDGVKIRVPDGVAHFLEHKLFEEEEGDVFGKFSALGASANAYTSFDMTGYLFSATANVYDSLSVLLRFVQNPYFTDENVEKEKGIIGQEIDMYRDDPSWNCFFNGLRAMYEKHPVRVDIAGTAESISKIDKTLLYQCYNAFYSPKNMILFVGGDVEPEAVREVVEKEVPERRSPEVEVFFPEEPEAVAQTEVEASFMVSRPMLGLCFKEKQMEDPVYADAVYEVLGTLLFGKSTSLYKELYEENLIGDSFSYGYSAGKGYAFMQLETESDNPQKVRERVLHYLEKVHQEGIGNADFERAKKSVYGSAVRMMDNIEQIAHAFVPMAFRGGDFLTYPDVVRSLTLNDVTDVLQNGLSAKNCVLSIVKPNTRRDEQ
ncbi:MAG: insulinase family protein [Ruminococcaceae bacterium]|nr:insulinase family protein [Oscillospiraceae bacterium]